MDLFSKIQQSLFELESLDSQRENIKITTSFITKRLFEEVFYSHSNYGIVNLNSRDNKIFGVEISFNHFSNDIVIYDETRACFDERFKITLSVLPAGVSQVDVNAKWKCCKCGWIGKHSESADKTPAVNDAWLLVCPKCGNKDEFYACG